MEQLHGVGGSEEEPIEDQWAVLRESARNRGTEANMSYLRHLSPEQTEPRIEVIGGVQVRTDLLAGKILKDILELGTRWYNLKTSLISLCCTVESVTGIDAKALYRSLRTQDVTRRAEAIVHQFTRVGYRLNPRVTEDPSLVAVDPYGIPSSKELELANLVPLQRQLWTSIEYRYGSVRLRINPPSSKKVDHVWVNLVSAAHPNQIIAESVITMNEGKMYIDLPEFAFRNDVHIKVIAWFENENDATTAYSLLPLELSDYQDVKHAIAVAHSMLILPEEESQAHEAIRSHIAHNFPLNNTSNLYWLLGSGYHDSGEYHAADLNTIGGKDTDRGDNVFAVASGTIRVGTYSSTLEKSLNLGAIVIEHDGWESVYLHMPIFETNQTTPDGKKVFEIRQQENVGGVIIETGEKIQVWDGKPIGNREQLGFVGGRFGKNDNGTYNESIDNAHLHFLARMNSKSINLRTAIAGAGISKVKAFDAGPDNDWETNDGAWRDVMWDDALQSWVNSAEYLILDRSEQVPNTPGVQTEQYWVAWHVDPSQRKRVVYKSKKYPGESIPSFRWVQIENESKEWNSTTRQFISH
jgi:hypothetical protein